MTKQLRYLSLLAFFTSTVALAGPSCPSHKHIHNDAHNLLNKVNHVAGMFKAATGKYSHLTRDAYKLRDAVQHFVTLMHGASPAHAHMKRDIARVTRACEHLNIPYRKAHGVHHNAHIAKEYDAMHAACHHLASVVNTHLSHKCHHHGHGHHPHGHHPHGHPHR